MNKLIRGICDFVVGPQLYISHMYSCHIGSLLPTPLVVIHVLILSTFIGVVTYHSLQDVIPYLIHERVLLYPLCFVVYENSASIMSQLDPTLWYLLHTKFMAGVTTWYINLFPGDESGFVGPSHLQGMLVRTIHN